MFKETKCVAGSLCPVLVSQTQYKLLTKAKDKMMMFISIGLYCTLRLPQRQQQEQQNNQMTDFKCQRNPININNFNTILKFYKSFPSLKLRIFRRIFRYYQK